MAGTELFIATEIITRKTYSETKQTIKNLYITYAPVTKRYGLAVVHRVRRAVIAAAEFYDAKWPTENPDCDKSILCMHEGRHKKGCFAYTVPIRKYARELKNV